MAPERSKKDPKRPFIPDLSKAKPLQKESTSLAFGDNIRARPEPLAHAGSAVGRSLVVLKGLNEIATMQGRQGPTHDAGHTLPVPEEALYRMLREDNWERFTSGDWGDVDGDMEVYSRVTGIREYLVVASDQNALALEKVTRYPNDKILMSCSLVASDLAKKKVAFSLFRKFPDRKLVYSGHYTLELAGHFTKEEPDWELLKPHERASMEQLAMKTHGWCRGHGMAYDASLVAIYFLHLITFDLRTKEMLTLAEVAYARPVSAEYRARTQKDDERRRANLLAAAREGKKLEAARRAAASSSSSSSAA